MMSREAWDKVWAGSAPVDDDAQPTSPVLREVRSRSRSRPTTPKGWPRVAAPDPMVATSAHLLRAARTVLRGGGGRHVVRASNALVHTGKEAMSVEQAGCLKWYACGPTVYDDAHLGHARTYVCFDVVRRILSRLTRVRVDYTLGVTDVDDKILARAAEAGETPLALARRYEARFFDDMAALNVMPPTRVARVTEHVPVVVRIVADLLANGRAYTGLDGTVYYDVSLCEEYGALEPGSVAAVDNDHPYKRDARDFALWKPSDGGVDAEHCRWDSPWGVGRPGWHVECNAVTNAIYGAHFDVHSGGIDLRFPHHTNELAIADGLRVRCGCPPPSEDGEKRRWVHTWLHAGHLRIAGRKMAKSDKNFVTIRDYLANGGGSDTFRMFCLLHRYSAPVEYGDDRLRDADGVLRRFCSFVATAQSEARHALCSGESIDLAPRCARAEEVLAAVARARSSVEEALVDDFDTPRAIAALATMVTNVNRATHQSASGAATVASAEAAHLVADTLQLCGVTAFETERVAVTQGEDMMQRELHALVDQVVRLRADVRSAAANKDWGAAFAACDRTRTVLRDKLGIELQDSHSAGKASWQRRHTLGSAAMMELD